MSLRRSVFLGLVNALALASPCGCGGGKPASHPAASAPASPSQLTKAQATAFAGAVNLQAPDLPGMSQTKPESERSAQPAARQLARCDGGVNPDRRVAQVHSAVFTGTRRAKFERISSEVEVMPTAALIAEDNAAVRSQRGLKCVIRQLGQEAAGASSKAGRIGPIKISKLPSPLSGAGADGTFEYRIGTSITAGPRTIPMYIDLLGFLSGPAEVDMTAIGAPRPVPSAREARLLSVLLARAKAHPL